MSVYCLSLIILAPHTNVVMQLQMNKMVSFVFGLAVFVSLFSCKTTPAGEEKKGGDESVDQDTVSVDFSPLAQEDSLLNLLDTLRSVVMDSIVDRRFTYAGKPVAVSYPNPLTILYNDCFALAYDEVRGAPAWVAYRVFNVEDYSTPPRPSGFLIDNRTSNRIAHGVYTHSGFDRGHMAPNFGIASRFGELCQRETFLMTNIIPQRPALNRQWWQRLERLIAREYSENYDQVWVITGPVYIETGQWIGERVKIPSHNFKIIQIEDKGELKVKAFLVHQEVRGNEPHETYFTTIRNIEDLTGLNFNPLWDQSIADSLERIQWLEMW